jgi:ATP-dependent Clp protease ATP-binding subunit ClpA
MEPLNAPMQKLLAHALAEAGHARAEAVEPVHLFLALLKHSSPAVAEALRAEGQEPTALRRRLRVLLPAGGAPDGPGRVSGRVQALLGLARRRAELLRREVDDRDLLLTALALPDPGLKDALARVGLPVRRLIDRLESGAAIPPEAAPPQPAPEPGARPPTPNLDRLGRDCTALARAGR